jgi:hypothetical protein
MPMRPQLLYSGQTQSMQRSHRVERIHLVITGTGREERRAEFYLQVARR